MSDNLPAAASHVSDSFDLVKKLVDVRIEDGFDLVSLDAVSLFTNIPIELALESVSRRWYYISDSCDIPQEEFLLALKLILYSTFFTFNGVVYQQNFDTPIGSPLSPLISDVVLQDLETKALQSLYFTPPFYYRYVDDIALAVPSCYYAHILEVFNSFHSRLQFILEISSGGVLNFLDVSLILTNNFIILDWYHKPTFSGRYLHFLSQHPLSQKRGTIISLTDRAFRLSHPSFHRKNLELVVRILLDNMYPLHLIFEVMHKRLKCLTGKYNNPNSQTIKNIIDENRCFLSVPYIPGLSERFERGLRGSNIRLSQFSLNSLKRYIRVHKDVLPVLSRSDVVYKIDCNDCDASYVGQTARQLGTRISEHRRNINHSSGLSVISDHRLQYDHDFNWNSVLILDHEPFWRKRLISEMIFIKRQKNSLNLQTDVECLPKYYLNVVDKLSKL